MANKARDLILAVIDGTPYENGKLKPAVRELDEYIEGLEAKYEHAVAALRDAKAHLSNAPFKHHRFDCKARMNGMCGGFGAEMRDCTCGKNAVDYVLKYKLDVDLQAAVATSGLCRLCQHSKHGGIECSVSTEPDGDRCPCEGP